MSGGMNMKVRVRKRSGFTLVELLIVIIIIGILAGMMFMSAQSATDKAEATTIVAGLRSMKAAAVLYHADYGTWPVWIYRGGNYSNYDMPHKDVLPGDYFDFALVGDGHYFSVMGSGSVCYSVGVLYIGDKKVSDGVKSALAGMAQDMNLYGSDGQPSSFDPDSMEIFTAADSAVAMLISK